MVAEDLVFLYSGTNDNIWRKDTKRPFIAMYSREEKVGRLMEIVYNYKYEFFEVPT